MKRPQHACAALAFASILLPFTTNSFALTWDSSATNPITPVDGSGNWSTTAANWSNGSNDILWPGFTAAALFGNGGAGNATVTLISPISTAGITFNPGANYTLQSTNANQLTIGAGGITLAPNTTAAFTGNSLTSSSTYDMVLSTNQTWDVAANSTLDIDTRFNTPTPSTHLAINKTGPGVLILEGSNGGPHDVENITYNILSGILRVQTNGNALGFSANNMNIADGAALELNSVAFDLNHSSSTVNISGSGINNTGAIRMTGGGGHFWAAPAGSGVENVNLLSPSTGIGVDADTTFALNENLGGSGGLNKLGDGTLALGNANSYAGNTTVTAGTLSLVNPNAIPSATVSVLNSSTLQLSPALPAAVKLTSLTLSGNSTTPASTLDLTTSKLILQTTPENKTATLALLQAQKLYGTTHSGGIQSSTLTANTTIALSDNAIRLATFPAGATNFGGSNNVDANSLLLTAAFKGDANLDGVVDIQDLTALAGNWQHPVTDWSQGDFDNSNFVDISDLTAIANNWQAGTGSGSGSSESFSSTLSQFPPFNPTTSTPEPASLFLALLTVPAILRRRPCAHPI